MSNQDRKIVGYDPNTGVPIYEEKKIISYDPNTGVPIYENSSNPVTDNKDKTITGYDPYIVRLLLMEE